MGDRTWTLLDAVEHNAAHPRSFFIPDAAARESLEPGDIVKLVFLPTDEDGGERMWVEVTDRATGGYVGVLDNDPIVVTELEAGARIEFEPRHVIDVYDPEPHPYEHLVARASERLFEGDEPPLGAAVFDPDDAGTERSDGRQASGWLLLVGDETDDELATPGRVRVPSLPWLVERYPELLPVVADHDGTAATYVRTGDHLTRHSP